MLLTLVWRPSEQLKKLNADLLVVHHGLIWGGIDYVVGITKEEVGIFAK